MLERLAVTSDPGREATLLGEMLADDLGSFPEDGWIAIDDYHYLASSVASEAFIEAVAQRSNVRLAIASRTRPSWIRPHDILVGDVLELAQETLAMTADEVERVLEDARAAIAPGLVALAGGWPAVINLAAIAPSADDFNADVPEAVFQAFADELYRGLDATVRDGLGVLAALPILDRELAEIVLGAKRAETVCSEAIRLGLLVDRAGRLDLHPLVSSFLESRRHLTRGEDLATIFDRASTHYMIQGELDAAFELAERIGRREILDKLLLDSMDELLRTARLTTLESWVSRSRNRIGSTPAILLAESEVALRQGRHLTAQSLAEQASIIETPDAGLLYRASLSGAKAAHIGARETVALELFRKAQSSAKSEEDRRIAKWGELTTAAALELDIAYDLLSELRVTAAASLDPTEAVRFADKNLVLGVRFGAIQRLGEARKVAELLPSVPDPFVRSSFRSVFAYALNLSADYQSGLETAADMIEDASRYRVDFALPYAFLMKAAALVGLRRFVEAHDALDESLRLAARCSDSFGQQSVYTGRVRAFLHEGRVWEASALEPPPLEDSLPAMRAEVWTSRGLALACAGRIDEATDLARAVSGSTRAIEPRLLTQCIYSVAALKERDTRLAPSIADLVNVAFEAGAVDFVITAYRASPELLVALLRNPQTAERAGYIIARSRDHELARSIGVDPLAAVDPASALSSREREVYDLLCGGMSNREIAAQLYISTSTVKVHVHHIFDKLGIRSRTALILNAALRRSQATPAIDDESKDSPSVG